MQDEKKSYDQIMHEIKILRHENRKLERNNQKQITLIKQLKENEKRVLESEARYLNLFDRAADMIVIINPKGKIIDLNRTFEVESHYTKAEMLFKNIFTSGLLTKKSISTIRLQLLRLLKGKSTPVIEIEGITKEGDIIPYELKAHYYKQNGRIVAIMAILRNVLRRKLMEKDLRESEEKFRSMVENSHAGLCVLDESFRIKYLNDQLAKIFSLDKHQILGQDFRSLLDAESAKFLADRFKRRQQGEATPSSYEINLVQINGQHLNLEINASLIRDSHGNINTLAQILNITERKKLEEQFRQVQKMEAIGQLAGGVAHDFNNILTVINGYAEIALKKVAKDDQISVYFNEILKSGKRAEKFTRQLLGFSRKQLIELKSVDVNEKLRDSGNMLRRLIGEDIDMVIHYGKDRASIRADLGQIEQILVNLVVNARDAINCKTSRAAEKKITVAIETVHLDETFVAYHAGSNIGHHVVISVSDTGIGMNDTIKNRIFEPFFTTKEREEGTGLGLSTVYGIVKQNNGSIYVYSEPEKGTNVKIYWPSETSKTSESVYRTRKSDLALGSEHILIAEDDEGVRHLVCDALTSLGYKVYQAANGMAALNMIRKAKKKFDLLITDVIMPEMGGRELVEKLKSAVKDLKILYTSGYTDSHIVHQGVLDSGINFIQKPYSIQVLAHKIREVLDQSQD